MTTTKEMPNQIHPNVSWTDHVKMAIDNIASTGKSEYKYTDCNRCIGKTICTPLCCSPCFVWSVVFRILCCPISCVQGYGPLSNNGFTEQSDDCIVTYYKSMDEKKTLQVSDTITSNELKDVVIYAVSKMKSTEDVRARYAIADFMFPVYQIVQKKRDSLYVGHSCSPIDLESLYAL